MLSPWCRGLVSSQPPRVFSAVLSPDELPRHKLVRAPVIETGSPEWRSGARPSSYVRHQGVYARLRRYWWEVDGIEPLARRDRVYSAATAPACPYGTSHDLVAGPGVAPVQSRLMRPRGFLTDLPAQMVDLPYWRMAEHSKPMPCGTSGVQSRAGEPCRFTIPIGLPDRSRTYVLDLRRVALIH